MIVELFGIEDGDRNVRYDLTASVEDDGITINWCRVESAEMKIGERWHSTGFIKQMLTEEQIEEFRDDIEAQFVTDWAAMAEHYAETGAGI